MHMGVSSVPPGRTVTHRNYDYNANEKIGRSYGQPDTAWALVGSATMDGDADGYSWNQVSVFQHRETRALIVAHDSGCSCYSPFESTTLANVQFLSRLVDFDLFVEQHEKKVEVYDAETRTYSTRRHTRVVDQIVRLREQVGPLIRKQRTNTSR